MLIRMEQGGRVFGPGQVDQRMGAMLFELGHCHIEKCLIDSDLVVAIVSCHPPVLCTLCTYRCAPYTPDCSPLLPQVTPSGPVLSRGLWED